MKADVRYDSRTRTLSIQMLDRGKNKTARQLQELSAALIVYAKSFLQDGLFNRAQHLMELSGQINHALNNPPQDPE